jgi:hypothetical protein
MDCIVAKPGSKDVLSRRELGRDAQPLQSINGRKINHRCVRRSNDRHGRNLRHELPPLRMTCDAGQSQSKQLSRKPLTAK